MAALLLVEDDEPLARLLARFLARGGYTVTVCGSAAEAVARLREAGPVYGCVVADLTLEQERSGLEVIDEALGTGRARRGLLMSGYPLERELFAAAVRERAEILQKPFTPAELLAALVALVALGAGPEEAAAASAG